MKLYDFSAYAKRRDVTRSEQQIEALIPRLNEPGAVIELKARVESWLTLHREVLRKVAT